MPGPDVAWPPGPIRTARLTLRPVQERDRGALVDLYSSPEVFAFLGGAREREEAERGLAASSSVPGRFVVDLDGAAIGVVTLDRRDPARPGRVRPEGGDLEVSYLLLPPVWGRGYATEAVAAVLEWAARACPREPVVVCTQSANLASLRLAERLGFAEQSRFEEFGAEQWFGVREPPAAARRRPRC